MQRESQIIYIMARGDKPGQTVCGEQCPIWYFTKKTQKLYSSRWLRTGGRVPLNGAQDRKEVPLKGAQDRGERFPSRGPRTGERFPS